MSAFTRAETILLVRNGFRVRMDPATAKKNPLKAVCQILWHEFTLERKEKEKDTLASYWLNLYFILQAHPWDISPAKEKERGGDSVAGPTSRTLSSLRSVRFYAQKVNENSPLFDCYDLPSLFLYSSLPVLLVPAFLLLLLLFSTGIYPGKGRVGWCCQWSPFILLFSVFSLPLSLSHSLPRSLRLSVRWNLQLSSNKWDVIHSCLAESPTSAPVGRSAAAAAVRHHREYIYRPLVGRKRPGI